MITFGQRITQARKACGLRLEDLAKKIRKPDGHPISIPYLSDLERDRRTPSAALLPQFASALHIPVDLLYLALGNLPPDLLLNPCSDEHILKALQVFRQSLQNDGEQILKTSSYCVHYQRAAHRTFPVDLSRYDAVRNGKSARLERPGLGPNQPAA